MLGEGQSVQGMSPEQRAELEEQLRQRAEDHGISAIVSRRGGECGPACVRVVRACAPAPLARACACAPAHAPVQPATRCPAPPPPAALPAAALMHPRTAYNLFTNANIGRLKEAQPGQGGDRMLLMAGALAEGCSRGRAGLASVATAGR